MLRQRVITALIMAALFLGAVIFLPLPALAVVFGLIIGGGAWEWSRLAGWNALMISALADAGAVLARSDYLDAARTAADFVESGRADDIVVEWQHLFALGGDREIKETMNGEKGQHMVHREVAPCNGTR